MWAARPQKQQVCHVSSAAGLFVCSVLLSRLGGGGGGGCGVSCVGDTWGLVVSGA